MRRFPDGVRTLPQTLGVLPCASLVFTLLALGMQYTLPLPREYTWFEPLRTLKTVAQLAGFPVVLACVYVLGVVARVGWAGSVAHMRSLSRPGAGTVLRAALLTLVLFVIDGVVLQSRRSPSDVVALIVIGAISSHYRPSRDELLRQCAYLIVATSVFLAICYFFTVLKALTFLTGRSYDAAIMSIESALLGAPPHRALAHWLAGQRSVLEWCDWVYFRFFHHMALTAVLLVAMRKPKERTEYLGALAICYVLAGPLYHLWPAAGPGYFEASYFSYLDDPSLMTHEVRAWLADNTSQVLSGEATVLRTWGYIACMPSLHVAQEFVMLYYARHSLPLFLLSLVFTLVTLVAVVALGWHYPIDSLAGGLLALLALRLSHRYRDVLLPSALRIADDAPTLIEPWFARFARRPAVTREASGA